MLSGDFFTIIALDQDNGTINALLEINANHQIFAGHFPGQPVVPGVCMMQMVKEILESALSKAARLSQADTIKFLTVIDPTDENIIRVKLKYADIGEGKLKVGGSLEGESVIYFKMNGVFDMEEMND